MMRVDKLPSLDSLESTTNGLKRALELLPNLSISRQSFDYIVKEVVSCSVFKEAISKIRNPSITFIIRSYSITDIETNLDTNDECQRYLEQYAYLALQVLGMYSIRTEGIKYLMKTDEYMPILKSLALDWKNSKYPMQDDLSITEQMNELEVAFMKKTGIVKPSVYVGEGVFSFLML